MAYDPSTDANCQAWYRFENGALTTDSSGKGNTLTDAGLVQETTLVKEGAGSVYCNDASSYGTRTNANLSANYPLRSTDTAKLSTVCGWFYQTIYSDSGVGQIIYAKGGATSGGRSYWIRCQWGGGTTNYFVLSTGYNNGNSGTTTVLPGHNVALNTWYHFGVAVNGITGAYYLQLYNDSSKITYSTSDTLANVPIFVNAAAMYIGRDSGSYYTNFRGYQDDLIVYNTIKTANEIDTIRDRNIAGGSMPLLHYYNRQARI